MRLHLSFVAARVRKTGAIEFIVRTGDIAAGCDSAKVSRKYQEFIAPEGGALRAKYSHVLWVIDNQERAQHEFPNPADLALAERQQLLLDARRTLRSAEQRSQMAAQTAAAASLAQEDFEAAQELVDELEDELQMKPATIAAPPLQPPRQPAIPADAKLEEFTDEQLLGVAVEYGIELTPSITRDILIASIRSEIGNRPNTDARDISGADTAPPPTGQTVSEAPGFTRLDAMADADLAALAWSLGVGVTASTTRHTLIEAIRVSTSRAPVSGAPLQPAPTSAMGETPLADTSFLPHTTQPELTGTLQSAGAASGQAKSSLGGEQTPSSEAAGGLALLTVTQLKEQCEARGMDTAGFRTKADYVAAIELDDELSVHDRPASQGDVRGALDRLPRKFA